jgi:hypothetical protein
MQHLTGYLPETEQDFSKPARKGFAAVRQHSIICRA